MTQSVEVPQTSSELLGGHADKVLHPLCTLHAGRVPINCCCIMVRLIEAMLGPNIVGSKFYCLHLFNLGMMMLLCGPQRYIAGSKTCTSELSGARHLRNYFPCVACSLSLSMSCSFVFIRDNLNSLV